MKLQVKPLYGDNKQTFSDVELSLTDTTCWGDYRIELHNEGKKQYVRVTDKDGKVLSYSKNLDVLIRKVLLAEKLLSELSLKSLFLAARGEHKLSFDLDFPKLWVEDNSYGEEFDKDIPGILYDIFKYK